MSRNLTVVPITSSSAAIIVAYYSLAVTVVGTMLNLLTFILLCRPVFRNTKERPTLHYMRAMAIFDILMLYGWNLDHFFAGIYNFTIQRTSIPMCRFLSFYNFLVLQSSAWLRMFVCLDRYLSLSRLHKTWFSDSKHVLIITGSIIGTCTLLNSVFFVYGCSFTKKGAISRLSWAFKIYPLWDYVNLGVYNAVPFFLMNAFNGGVVYHLIRLRRTSTIQNSQIRHRSISITLLITTVLFLLMTIPVNVVLSFFSAKVDVVMKRFLDGILYTYHITSFPLYMLTFSEFRRECIAIFRCRNDVRRVTPTAGTQLRSVNVV